MKFPVCQYFLLIKSKRFLHSNVSLSVNLEPRDCWLSRSAEKTRSSSF